MPKISTAVARFQQFLNDELDPQAEGAKRSCGECSLCCTLVGVSAEENFAAKGPYTPCEFLNEDGCGCSIYADRPLACRTYRCEWLTGWLPEELKPSKTGVIMHLERSEAKGDVVIHVYLAKHSLLDDPEGPAADIIELAYQMCQHFQTRAVILFEGPDDRGFARGYSLDLSEGETFIKAVLPIGATEEEVEKLQKEMNDGTS